MINESSSIQKKNMDFIKINFISGKSKRWPDDVKQFFLIHYMNDGILFLQYECVFNASLYPAFRCSL